MKEIRVIEGPKDPYAGHVFVHSPTRLFFESYRKQHTKNIHKGTLFLFPATSILEYESPIR